MKYTKQAIDFSEQLSLLKQRGLIIDDEGTAIRCLHSISYFRLTSYLVPMESDSDTHAFSPHSHLHTAIALYNFDRKLRSLVFIKSTMMIQNDLFRQCLAAIPEEQKAEFELSFGIAERISEVLKAKNLTQKDFAQKLHKRESEISKWLTGRHNFTMQTIAKIETALGCKLINIAE